MLNLKNIAVTIILSLLTCVAFAKDNVRSEKVQELIKLVKMDEMVNQQAEIGIRQIISQEPKLAPYKEDLAEIFNEILNPEEFSKFVTKVFEDNFDENEIQEMINFYKSPIGQKCLAKMPVITQETIAYMSQNMNKNKDKLEALFRKIDAQIKKEAELQNIKK